MRRRTFLASAGTVSSALLSGCQSPLADRSVRLGYLDVVNSDSEPHRFHVRVHRDDDRVHDSTHEIDGVDGNVHHGEAVECSWGDTAGEYVVSARVDGEEWHEQSLVPAESMVSSGTDCVVVGVWYRTDGLGFQVAAGCDRDYDGLCSFATTAGQPSSTQ